MKHMLQIGSMTGVILLFAFVAKVATADKAPRAYYVEQGRIAHTCVVGDYDYWPDSNAFCTDDVEKAIHVLRELNKDVRK